MCVPVGTPRECVHIIVVYVENVLLASATKHDDEQTLKDFYTYFLLRDLDELRSPSDIILRETETPERWWSTSTSTRW